MKLIKPNKIAFLQRTYGLGEQYRYVISSILFFDLKTSKILTENVQWKKVSEALGQEALDHALPKTTGEYLLAGHAYAEDQESTQMQVNIDLGGNKKTLTIFGERRWKRNLLGQWRPTKAACFEKVSLNYQNAFGGENIKTNPTGTGFDIKSLLPRVENTNQLLTKPNKKLLPAGTMPLSIMWPQRSKYHGSYKGDWFNKYFPALPPGTDTRLFNSAPQDQQFTDFLKGDEVYNLVGFSPEQKTLAGQLPNIKARSFITNQNKFSEVALVLDTVWFMPDQQLGVLIFRGQVDVANAEASEITQVMLAFENLADEAKSLKYYQQVSALRTNPKTASAHMLNEGQLSPEKSEDEILERKNKLDLQNQKTLDKLKRQQKSSLDNSFKDVDTAQIEFAAPELSAFDQLLDEDVANSDIDLSLVLEKVNQQLETLQKDNENKLLLLEQDKKLQPNSVVPEPINLQQAIAGFDCMKIKQETLESFKDMSKQELQELQQQQLQQLKIQQMALTADEENNMTNEATTGLKDLVLTHIAEGKSLSAKNLTGANLSGLVFNNIDFSHSILSFCQLVNTKFINCRFDGAAFVNANISQCEFENCNMLESNLSGTKGIKPHFKASDLSLSLWRGCNINTLLLTKCHLKQAQFLNSKLVHSRLIQCQFMQGLFSECQLNDSDFEFCEIKQTTFSETLLDMTRWYNSQFERSVMQLCPMRLASFIGAKMTKVVFSIDTLMTRANLSNAEFNETSFRSLLAKAMIVDKATFSRCDFSEADLSASRFSNSQFIQNIFAATNLSECRINNCNCYKSRFRKAKFINSQLNQVNMLEADLMWALFQNTSLEDCINLSSVALRDVKARKKIKETKLG